MKSYRHLKRFTMDDMEHNLLHAGLQTLNVHAALVANSSHPTYDTIRFNLTLHPHQTRFLLFSCPLTYFNYITFSQFPCSASSIKAEIWCQNSLLHDSE